MYQQPVTAVRVAQYHQQCLREAAVERSLHSRRHMPSTTPARLGAWARMFFAARLRPRRINPTASQ